MKIIPACLLPVAVLFSGCESRPLSKSSAYRELVLEDHGPDYAVTPSQFAPPDPVMPPDDFYAMPPEDLPWSYAWYYGPWYGPGYGGVWYGDWYYEPWYFGPWGYPWYFGAGGFAPWRDRSYYYGHPYEHRMSRRQETPPDNHPPAAHGNPGRQADPGWRPGPGPRFRSPGYGPSTGYRRYQESHPAPGRSGERSGRSGAGRDRR